MKTLPYVKVEYAEAISGKRELLSSQAGILKILKIIQNYKLVRKKELIKKDRLRLALANLKKKIKSTLIELPDIETNTEIVSSSNVQEITKTKSIEAELREIQEKLAKLEEQ